MTDMAANIAIKYEMGFIWTHHGSLSILKDDSHAHVHLNCEYLMNSEIYENATIVTKQKLLCEIFIGIITFHFGLT